MELLQNKCYFINSFVKKQSIRLVFEFFIERQREKS